MAGATVKKGLGELRWHRGCTLTAGGLAPLPKQGGPAHLQHAQLPHHPRTAYIVPPIPPAAESYPPAHAHAHANPDAAADYSHHIQAGQTLHNPAPVPSSGAQILVTKN